MEAVNATSAWIHVQEVVLAVGHHLEDVGMAAEEEIDAWLTAQIVFHSLVVSTRIAANVGHEDAQAFDGEVKVVGRDRLHAILVDVAIDDAQDLGDVMPLRT